MVLNTIQELQWIPTTWFNFSKPVYRRQVDLDEPNNGIKDRQVNEVPPMCEEIPLQSTRS